MKQTIANTINVKAYSRKSQVTMSAGSSRIQNRTPQSSTGGVR